MEEPPAPAATIALVEDDEAIRDIVGEVLRGDGYTVFTAADGVQGLTLLRTLGTSVSLVLLDYMMPGLDGSQVLAVLKGDPMLAPIPVIVVSAAARQAPATGFAGIAGWLSKPVEMPRLLEAVRGVIGQVERGWLHQVENRAEMKFLARRVVDVQELELAVDKELYRDVERVARNLGAAAGQAPVYEPLRLMTTKLTRAARAGDAAAVRAAAREVQDFVAEAARAARRGG
jgi:CheY-like chemotaxis protein